MPESILVRCCLQNCPLFLKNMRKYAPNPPHVWKSQSQYSALLQHLYQHECLWKVRSFRTRKCSRSSQKQNNSSSCAVLKAVANRQSSETGPFEWRAALLSKLWNVAESHEGWARKPHLKANFSGGQEFIVEVFWVLHRWDLLQQLHVVNICAWGWKLHVTSSKGGLLCALSSCVWCYSFTFTEALPHLSPSGWI